MASALELNAEATIVSGQGLAISSNIASAISSYQSLPTVTLIAKIFNDATTANADIRGNLWSALDTVGSGVNYGHFLIDFYPTGVTPTNSTGAVNAYHVDVTPIYDENPAHWTITTDGEGGSVTTKPIIGYNHIPAMSTASVSNNVNSQANLPFANGPAGFANVFMMSYTWANQVFDTVSSINLLKNKTYGQSGAGYSSPTDILTNGIGHNGPLLASVVESWGSMYNVKHLDSFYDPYVFGEYLLLQGFGIYGGLETKLSAAGLDLGTLSRIPTSASTTALEAQVQKVLAPFVGQLDLPDIKVLTTSTPITGSSPAVVRGIYKTVTGTALDSIVTGTQINIHHRLISLADYLDFTKVVPANLRQQLASIGIVDFPSLAKVLYKALGSGTFSSWASLAKILKSIDSPVLQHTSTTAGQPVLTGTAIATLTQNTGSGTGPFGNPTMIDLLGAVAGIPYEETFNYIVSKYPDVSQGIESALNNLDSAVSYYLTHYTYTTSTDPESGGSTTVLTPAPLEPVTAAVGQLNDALNALPKSSLLTEIQQKYDALCTHLSLEVSNLHSAGIVFNSGSAAVLKQFSKSAVGFSSNDDTLLSKQVMSNVIADNAFGDSIRAAVAEQYNRQLLSSVGIDSHNDPQPGLSALMAKAQNIPIEDYMKRII